MGKEKTLYPSTLGASYQTAVHFVLGAALVLLTRRMNFLG